MRRVMLGFTASVGLLVLYAGTMTILSGWEAAIEQFQALWYLMIPLVVTFGIQVGLYAKLRSLPTVSSGVSMLACCAHHAADVLPILGLSAAAALIAQYQKPILIAGLAINLVGIGILWKHVQK